MCNAILSSILAVHLNCSLLTCFLRSAQFALYAICILFPGLNAKVVTLNVEAFHRANCVN